MILQDKRLPILRSTLIDERTFMHGFTTKAFGDGRDENDLVQIDVRPVQTHSTDIHIIDTEDQIIPAPVCDGIISTIAGVTISVVTADCVPIIYVDPVESIIGVSHQGWKGTLHTLPALMVEEMIHLGSDPENIYAVCGAAINDCCYRIYGERKTWFESVFAEHIFTNRDENEYLNLYKANRSTLLESGILPENIDIFPFCTSCDETRFYSYQRDKGITGEMAAFVGII